MKITLLILACVFPLFASALEKDCSEAYGGRAATCIQIVCDAKYETFIGTWSGPFLSYVRELSSDTKIVHRPYNNSISYSKNDCLQNVDSGDTFIIGRRVDQYPEFNGLPEEMKTGLLITGKNSMGKPFLRTSDGEGVFDYQLEFQNLAANISIWSLHIPASSESPEMTFTTIDGQDFSAINEHKRNVTVTMIVGPVNQPIWQAPIAFGFHTKKNLRQTKNTVTSKCGYISKLVMAPRM